MNPTTLLILSMIYLVRAKFNETTAYSVWEGNSVQPNSAGTYCYYPAPNQGSAKNCTGGHSSDPAYQPILDMHLTLSQGWSIAYYSRENLLLGNQGYSVAGGTGMRMCLSGTANDGTYQTLCMGTNYDNNIAEPGSYCQVGLGQHYVSDKCYTAMTAVSNIAPSSSSSSSFTSDATSSSPSPPRTTTSDSNRVPSSSGENGLSTGEIASLVVGIVGVILAAVAVWYARAQLKLAIDQLFGGKGNKHADVDDEAYLLITKS